LATFQCKNRFFSLHLSIDLNFRHTSKKIKGGSPKKILEKKNVFPEKYVELRMFDGTENSSTIFSFVINAHLSSLPKILQQKSLSDYVSIVFGLISMLVLKFKIAILVRLVSFLEAMEGQDES
jgi:hypothetical protein